MVKSASVTPPFGPTSRMALRAGPAAAGAGLDTYLHYGTPEALDDSRYESAYA